MAEGIQNICGSCGYTVEAWSDGNPYFIDARGEKQYAYHPDEENLAKCVGNDEPYLCLACGEEFMVDSRSLKTSCSKCQSTDTATTFQLENRRCPVCKKGKFAINTDFFGIS